MVIPCASDFDLFNLAREGMAMDGQGGWFIKPTAAAWKTRAVHQWTA